MLSPAPSRLRLGKTLFRQPLRRADDMPAAASKTLKEMYTRLWAAYGPQHWWPVGGMAKRSTAKQFPIALFMPAPPAWACHPATEVVVGAILTQNTSWKNVERAIENLRQTRSLNWSALRLLTADELARLIQPSGTYRLKAARLKAFVDSLWQSYGGSLEAMLDGDLESARLRLLTIQGIGPETADAIMLYAGDRPTFVVDAYTRRILRRHFVINDKADYESVRRLFHRAIKPDVAVYNEFHALLVNVGKHHCRSRARCEGCPLVEMPHDPQL